jgi:hypothetical protein
LYVFILECRRLPPPKSLDLTLVKGEVKQESVGYSDEEQDEQDGIVLKAERKAAKDIEEDGVSDDEEDDEKQDPYSSNGSSEKSIEEVEGFSDDEEDDVEEQDKYSFDGSSESDLDGGCFIKKQRQRFFNLSGKYPVSYLDRSTKSVSKKSKDKKSEVMIYKPSSGKKSIKEVHTDKSKEKQPQEHGKIKGNLEEVEGVRDHDDDVKKQPAQKSKKEQAHYDKDENN